MTNEIRFWSLITHTQNFAIIEKCIFESVIVGSKTKFIRIQLLVINLPQEEIQRLQRSDDVKTMYVPPQKNSKRVLLGQY
jgi:hypothetical protein